VSAADLPGTGNQSGAEISDDAVTSQFEATALRFPVVALLCFLFALASPAMATTKHHHVAQRATSTAGSLQTFSSEAAAQAHCPRDTVVWLNTESGIYHEKGMRWYGNTREGAYVCRPEADAAGERDTKNGQ